MMRKKRIIDESRKQFNVKGLANVTIRQIAVRLKMSAGNLTYHFQKRGDIVAAIFEELTEIEQKFLALYVQKTLSKEQLKRLMKAHAKAMFDFRFFWLDYMQIARENKVVKKQLDALMQHRLDVLDFDLANYLNQFLYTMATHQLPFTVQALEQHFGKIEARVLG